MPVRLTCKECGKIFYRAPSKCHAAQNHYCSRKCMHMAFRGENNPNWKDEGRERQCAQCGKSFRVMPHLAGTKKYCSRRCAGEVRSRQVACVCACCGMSFSRKASGVGNGPAVFCSKDCYEKDRGKVFPDSARVATLYAEGYSLAQIAAILETTPGSVYQVALNTSIDMRPPGVGKERPKWYNDAGDLHDLYWGQKLTLSEIGALAGVTDGAVSARLRKHGIPRRPGVHLREAPKGVDSPNWKGGTTPRKIAWGRGSEGRAWRTTIYRKAGHRCEICGDAVTALHAHHVWPQAEYPEVEAAPWNGVALCKHHHHWIHNKRAGICNAILQARVLCSEHDTAIGMLCGFAFSALPRK